MKKKNISREKIRKENDGEGVRWEKSTGCIYDIGMENRSLIDGSFLTFLEIN